MSLLNIIPAHATLHLLTFNWSLRGVSSVSERCGTNDCALCVNRHCSSSKNCSNFSIASCLVIVLSSPPSLSESPIRDASSDKFWNGIKPNKKTKMPGTGKPSLSQQKKNSLSSYCILCIYILKRIRNHNPFSLALAQIEQQLTCCCSLSTSVKQFPRGVCGINLGLSISFTQ